MKSLGRVLALAGGLWLAIVPMAAQMDEYSIKAAYLYNFSKYVDWPDTAFTDPKAPLMICIVGDDPFQGKLEQAVAGRSAGNGRPLTVARLRNSEPERMKDCQMLFLSKSDQQRSAEILNSVKDRPVLTVADFSPFAEDGGVADLRIEGSKVKVDLNMGTANRLNLKVSGRLQQVANLVGEAK